MTETTSETKDFGSCCAELKEVLGSQEFEPMMTIGDNGVLYMSVGLLDMEGEDASMVEHPMFFCPFCGSRLQTAEEIEDKVEDGSDDDAKS